MRLGIIGGSSLVTFDPKNEFDAIGLKIASSTNKTVDTEYGKVNVKIMTLKGSGMEHTLIFMQRHSHGSSCGIASGITPPHSINHKANIRALADQGVDAIVATTSVGARALRPAAPSKRAALHAEPPLARSRARRHH